MASATFPILSLGMLLFQGMLLTAIALGEWLPSSFLLAACLGFNFSAYACSFAVWRRRPPPCAFADHYTNDPQVIGQDADDLGQ